MDRNLLDLRKPIRCLKSDGGITIRFHSVYWVGVEMAIEVHCDAGNIATKGVGVMIRLVSVALLERKRTGWIKIRVTWEESQYHGISRGACG